MHNHENKGPLEAYETLEEVLELISSIIDASEIFRHKIEDAYDSIELTFLKRLHNAITLVEHDALLIKEDFTHMQQTIIKD